ncbi:MAG: trypsin-like peptidase domain-containing protein [Actinomycetota bacterium]
MSFATRQTLPAALLALILLGAACGTGSTEPDTFIGSADEGDRSGVGAADDRSTGADDGSSAPAGPITSVDGVEPAVAYIQATGALVDPVEGELTGNWTGTGFFVALDGADTAPGASGILVTNNHVATGAAFLEVYVNGETEPRTATILGQDECSDLAVLRVDGDGFHTIDFHTDPFDVGVRVYAAGFPLGDPEYTLTTGIIAKRDADGATNWTSVEEVVQHDARINPGNSGGPLVTEGGRVIGINYAVNAQTDQNFAITAVDAIPIIEHLATGQDRESLGINGQAILLDDGTNGVFVQSVETGGPADRLGIEPGDFITSIEDVPAAPDGTMAGYCKILRSKGDDQPLKIEVFRPGTGQVLRGTVNADDELESVGTVAASSGDVTSTDGSTVVEVSGVTLRIPATMIGWELRTVVVGDRELLVSVADTDEKRSTGLGRIPSAFDLDGVLFTYPSARDTNFWTFQAEFPIDFAFFDDAGRMVTAYRSAPPCAAEPCRFYPATGTRYAISTPGGGLDSLTDGAFLQL